MERKVVSNVLHTMLSLAFILLITLWLLCDKSYEILYSQSISCVRRVNGLHNDWFEITYLISMRVVSLHWTPLPLV